MAQHYQVVFTGRLRPGTDPEQAARDFAVVFKVAEDKARNLVMSDAEHILKRDIDEANANRYRDILEEIGLEVRVEAAGTPLTGAAGGPPPAGAWLPPAAPGSVGDEVPPPDDEAGRNPYAPPSADLTPPLSVGGAGGDAMTGPHRVPAGHGWQWLTGAWAQFKAQPWSWVGGVLVVYLLNMLLSLVPIVGGLASIVLGPIFLGGLMLGARAQQHGGRFRSGSAFDGFSSNGGQLALVGVFYFVAILGVFMIAALVLLAGGLLSADAMQALASEDPDAVAAVAGPGLVLLMLVVMLLIIPVIMAYWFAPALVALNGLQAMQAMVISFRACLMNFVPFMVYGLGLLLVMIGVGVVFGIAGAVIGSLAGQLAAFLMLLVIPVMVALATVIVVSIYTSYRDIFYPAAGTSQGSTWAAV